MADITVGERIQMVKPAAMRGKLGTCRFVGTTSFQPGTWYGLELDSRDGKHTGEVEGVRYFTCPAGHGLMVPARNIVSVEKTIFRKPARVFSFNSKDSAWVEKGTGAFTLRQSTKADKHARIFMTKDNDADNLLVSHPVHEKTQLERSRGSDTAWVYKVKKHVLNKNCDEVLAVQFANAEVASDFFRIHTQCCKELKASQVDAVAANTSNVKSGSTRNTKAKRRLTIDGANGKIDVSQLEKTMEEMGLAEAEDDNSAVNTIAGDVIKHLGCTRQKGVSKKGYAADPRIKPYNQDALVHVQDDKTGAWLFCVLDGHGELGHDVSKFVKMRLADRVFKHPNFEKNPAVAMKDSIERIEKDLLEAVDCRLSGSTCVMCIVWNGIITCANIGDSRVIIGSRSASGEITSKDISHDHKPDLPAEKQRIEQVGGRVFAIDYGDDLPSPARVWLKDAQLPGLAMSRSVGDTVGKMAGVISTPEITRHVITEDDRFCVIASDGLWEFIESPEAVKMVFSHETPIDALDHCMTESHRRWLMHEVVTDDTTVCIFELGDVTSAGK